MPTPNNNEKKKKKQPQAKFLDQHVELIADVFFSWGVIFIHPDGFHIYIKGAQLDEPRVEAISTTNNKLASMIGLYKVNSFEPNHSSSLPRRQYGRRLWSY
jgi:hypothetical protein